MEARLRPPVVERHLIAEAEKVTVKAIIASALLVVSITVAGCHSAFLRYDLIGTGHLPRSALFPVMLFAAVNPVWRFLFMKPLFTSSELLFIYCALVIMSDTGATVFKLPLHWLGLSRLSCPSSQHA
ncbi:hypothetical protein B0813_002274 [Candidatus Fervidibacteria bacterium JGI MDM2 SSWTFF-3-K9]